MNASIPIAADSGIDIRRYGRLMARLVPKVIQTEIENERALAIVESLMEKGDGGRTPEENVALDLLTVLIEKFEQRSYPIPEGDPAGALQLLMESKGLKAIDLAEVLGSRAKVSEILSAKRSISKTQAKQLGRFFHVSPAVFI
jgi:HTH-type transcriptional regulator/antitoxin HigA